MVNTVNTPISTNENVHFTIQSSPINTNDLLSPHPSEGARLVFTGLVREYNKEQAGVTHIEYYCYEEMAIKEGLKILHNALEKFEIARVSCVHRIGKLLLQETAIRLEIGSGHRLAALNACEYIMDEIKQHVPIWKKEFYNTDNKGTWL